MVPGKRTKKTDQADAVVGVVLCADGEKCTRAVERGHREMLEQIHRINETRKGKHKLRSPELTFLNAA
jgi:hypothetical protein